MSSGAREEMAREVEKKNQKNEARVEQLKKQGALSCVLAHVPEKSFW